MGELPSPAQPLRGSLFFFQKESPPNPWPGLHDKQGTHSKVCEVVNAQWWFYNPISLDKGRPCLNNIAGPLIAHTGTGSFWPVHGCANTNQARSMFGHSLEVFVLGSCSQRPSGQWESTMRALFPSSSLGFHRANESDNDETPHTHKIMSIYILNIWRSVPYWSFTTFTFF